MPAIGKGVAPLSPLTIPTESQEKQEVANSSALQASHQNSSLETVPPPKSSTLEKFQHGATYTSLPPELKLQIFEKLDGENLARVRRVSRETMGFADGVNEKSKQPTGLGLIERAKKNYFETEIMFIALSSSNFKEFKKGIDALFKKAGTSTPVKINIGGIQDIDQSAYISQAAKNTTITVENSLWERQMQRGREMAFALIG